MRSDVSAPADPTLLSRAGVTVTLFRTGRPRDLIVGTGGLVTTDLTPYVERVSHKSASATVTLTHAGELAGANRPRRGQSIEIRIGADVAWRGVVGAYTEDEDRGSRHGSLTARRRDAFPAWRVARRMTPLFSVGTDLGYIARTIAEALGLTPEEYALPDTGVSLVHDTAQIADVNGWEMLRTVLEPGLQAPFVDALGVLKPISRDVRRAPALVVPRSQIVRRGRASSDAAATTVRVRWLDPNLTRVDQQEQTLAETNLTAGFFKWHNRKEVWWSDDHTLRADVTRLEVKQSINDGLLHVGHEWYNQTSLYGGVVQTEIDEFLPSLAVGSLIALLAADWIPDEVVVGGLIASGGFTIPVGRVARGILEGAIWLAVMTIGQGIYEIKGVPYDFVHAVNEVEAYDENGDPHEEAVDEIENFFLPNGAAAEALAVGELIYRARAGEQDAVTIADDLRPEPGDVLELDGDPYYVIDYTRDLSRPSSPELKLEGFYV